MPNPDLYEKFKTDPLVADEWMAQIQVILYFMGISDRDKVKCASFVLKKDARYWWETLIMMKDMNHMT